MSDINEMNVGPRWYVAHTYSGYENKVMASLEKIVENRGLGHRFLKHVERCKLLIFIIDMAGTDNRKPADDYTQLLVELENFDPVLLDKPRIIVANKMDCEGSAKNLTAFKRKHKGLEIVKISCLTGDGLDALKDILRERVEAARRLNAEPEA